MTRKRTRRLSEDELAVWQQVAKSANPLNPNRKTPVVETPLTSGKTLERPTSHQIPPFRIGETARYDHSKGHDLSPTIGARLQAQSVRMDQKTYRTMRRGKLRPERKIDLHGMHLSQAHPALSRFVISAQSDGCRLVLVVTGKGKERHDDGPIPTPRGVLRNQVPDWLRQPPLCQLVLQVTEAHVSHGGSGAYYVYLARRR